ncbi:MAG: leucine-rich repeat domain-containing protein [Clostridium sp.]|nr:leucine-rich repeat domain-containing protein [Clostridium sp.]
MKKMRKTMFLWVLLLLFACGNTVEAADAKADAIIQEMQKAMKEVKVIGLTMTVDGNLFMQVEADDNTGISYMSVMGTSTMWIDTNQKMTYIYDEESGQYYFMPMDNEDTTVDESLDSNTEVDESLVISYVGEEVYKAKDGDVECYKLLVTDPQDPSGSLYYYIQKDTYRLYGAESNDAMIKIQYYYPQSVVIPEESKQKAKIAPGYTVIKNKVEYMVTYVKNKPVLYVYDGRKAKGNVKIPKTMKICGKEYPVQGIDDLAFYNNKKITSVKIGKNVRTIGKQAFCGCKKLKNVTIQSSVLTKIGKKAFYKNAKTLTFKLPKKKASKYESLIQKSQTNSEIKISKY